MEVSPQPQSARRPHNVVHRTVGWRIALATAVWLITRGMRPDQAVYVKLIVDTGCAWVSWLSLDDGCANGGEEFGRNDHWTKLLLGAPVLGAMLAISSLWNLVRALR